MCIDCLALFHLSPPRENIHSYPMWSFQKMVCLEASSFHHWAGSWISFPWMIVITVGSSILINPSLSAHKMMNTLWTYCISSSGMQNKEWWVGAGCLVEQWKVPFSWHHKCHLFIQCNLTEFGVHLTLWFYFKSFNQSCMCWLIQLDCVELNLQGVS